ncbi:hypothetical protein PGT21_050020 [Puccinia graminis f. sp. tritici]|uniref:Uncharacterized protein n=1 Tax=Puccinia graminis f. sp. tritici TaxID=56615 RepID=A0A5B0QWG3_PUCGR|nr:hypothetical protein PGT21_050020 [Puccinia graminis f. sp. tritici]
MHYMFQNQLISMPNLQHLFEVGGALETCIFNIFSVHFLSAYIVYPSKYALESILPRKGLKFMSQIMNDNQKRRGHLFFLKAQNFKYFSQSMFFKSTARSYISPIYDNSEMIFRTKEVDFSTKLTQNFHYLTNLIFENKNFIDQLENHEKETLEIYKQGKTQPQDPASHEFKEILQMVVELFVGFGDWSELTGGNLKHHFLFSIIDWVVENYGNKMFEGIQIPPRFWDKFDAMSFSSKLLAALNRKKQDQILHQDPKLIDDQIKEIWAQFKQQYFHDQEIENLGNYLMLFELKEHLGRLDVQNDYNQIMNDLNIIISKVYFD